MYKAAKRREIEAAGVGDEYVNHAQPLSSADTLIPALLHMDKVEIKQIQPRNSATFHQEIVIHGGQVSAYPFRYYRTNTMSGKNRRLDNSDIMLGKEPLYGDLSHFMTVFPKIKSLVKEMLSHYRGRAEQGFMLARMELEDLEKITIQQWRMTGYFVDSPISPVMIPRLDPEAMFTLTAIAKRYAAEVRAKAPAIAAASMKELLSMDSDPPDTMTGVPTLASGADTLTARREILLASPIPDKHPGLNYHLALDVIGAGMGLAPGLIYSPVLSTRMGPLKKPTKLYSTSRGMGYQANYEAVGMYNRVRNVYPAPYHVNFLLSPLYVWMSTARKNILGLWHDPSNQAAYIAKLRAQGKYAYALDFSGMDTAMSPNIIMGILSALRAAGFPQWPLDMFSSMYPNMGVTLPSINHEVGSATYITGLARPWCSGFKLTSEFDTIYGAAVLLTALKPQIPDILDQWIAGKFTFAELGDDIFFTTSKPLNLDEMGGKALKQWGATIKAVEDSMFLKWILPFSPDVKVITRPFSRFIQQTFFNEDRYSGIEGGDKPPAILRIGLSSRLIGLRDHPDWDKWWPTIYEILITLPPFKDTTSRWKADLRAGKPSMDDGDEIAILNYAKQVPSYFAGLVDRSKFEPSAAATIELLKNQGMTVLVNPPDPMLRRVLVDALYSPMDSVARQSLTARVRQNYV